MSRPFDLEPAAWAQLRRLLDEALAIESGERARWVDALSVEHDALKPHLHRLLERADQPSDADRFETMPRMGDQATDAEPAAPTVGPYHCLRLLGEGGMSSVWLAERTDVLLNRPVALKLPRAAWRHAGLAQRMAQEREILGLLDHPNIARIYDAGVAPDGQPWLALEYVEGLPIDEHCRLRSLDLRARVALFKQVAEAVAHAHAKLVVHRDLKPSNILVTPNGIVRLLDFGIAKLVGEAQAGQPELTVNAARVMTPRYAAPEQVLGQPISTATDIYALGVLLFELLTGQRPYRLARDTAAALEEAVLHAQPPRPSTVAADRKLARALRGDLDTIVLKALKKAPRDRYGTATALADDLDHWLHQRPVRARPDSARYRASKFILRNRLGIGIAGALLLSLTAGLAAALWQADRAQREAAKALAIKDYLVSLFAANDIDQQDGQRKRQQSVQQLLEQSADSLGTGLGTQPEVRDELQRVVGGLLQDLTITDAAVRIRQQRVQQLDAARAPAAQQVQAIFDLAVSLRERGDVDASRTTLLQAVQLCSHETAAVLACRTSQVELGRLDVAARRIEPALARVEPVVAELRREAPRSAATADAVELLGILRILQNRGEEAWGLLQQSMDIRRELWRDQPVRLAKARRELGRDLWTMRYLSQAESELRSAWEITRDALGADHAATATTELNLGRLTAYLGLRPDGLDHVRHASAVFFREGGRFDPPDVLTAHVVLANLLVVDGYLAEAGPEIKRALGFRITLQETESYDPTLDQSHARYLLDTGRFAEARAALEALRAKTAAIYGLDHPDTAERSLRIANVLIAEGQLAAAQREIDAVLGSQDSREAVFGSVKHKALLARAQLLLEQGRADLAQPIIDEQIEVAKRTPRENVYRDVLYLVHDLAARTAAATGHPQQASEHFEQAIALLRFASPNHPYLAATRARYALHLLGQQKTAAAEAQIERAQAALQAQPLAGQQFRRPLLQAQEALAKAGRIPAPAASRVVTARQG
jgi:eukaryotic-like serine/threonine-protein kinase